MATEIEFRYLVDTELWKPTSEGVEIMQGYLCLEPERTVRIRTMDTKAFITVKGKKIRASAPEFEYEIPYSDAIEMLNMCVAVVTKIRYRERHKGELWEIDVFTGQNTGLVIAELEREHDMQGFEHPEWLGRDLTYDYRFSNASLAKDPWIPRNKRITD